MNESLGEYSGRDGQASGGLGETEEACTVVDSRFSNALVGNVVTALQRTLLD